MIRSLASLALVIGASAPAAFAADSAAAELYAAVSMTKGQVNSPTPLDSGLYRLLPNNQWEHFGPRVLGVRHISMSPVNPDVMLISAADGVIRSEDGGKTWRKTTGWDVLDVRCTVFDPSEPAHVYAATAWGPLRSIDGGATWLHANAGLDRLYSQAIIVDSTTRGRVLLGGEDGLYVSTDGALKWRRADFPAVTVLRLAQSGADPRLFLCGTQGKGGQISRDGGRTWTPVDPALASADIYSAALSRDDSARMALGGWDTGVHVSADGGKTWTDRTAGLPSRNIFVLIFDANVKGRLWASTFEEGSFYSDDLGLTWKSGGLYGAYASDFVFLKPSR